MKIETGSKMLKKYDDTPKPQKEKKAQPNKPIAKPKVKK